MAKRNALFAEHHEIYQHIGIVFHQEIAYCVNGYLHCFVLWIAVCAGGDEREGDRFAFMFECKFKRSAVA